MKSKMRGIAVVATMLLYSLFSLANKDLREQDDASLARRMGYQMYTADTTQTKILGLHVDALAFFKDNEFDGNVQHGYSLPGVRLLPRLSYTPIKEIMIELGMYALFYSGANKYPCYVYHDIPKWKGDQYQVGAHMLPFFRATARFDHITLAVGDIYGGATHRLIEPLYNPELILSDDPEMGCQFIVDTRRWHSDLWLNWQSYIFDESAYQEAFTLGWTQQINIMRSGNGSKTHRLDIPIQMMIQHRGGEQLVENKGVQTIANGAFGFSYMYHSPLSNVITGIQAEAMALYCFQQKGDLWPFGSGNALWVKTSLDFMRDIRLTAGFFAAKDFCSLYGNPYFGTLSTKYPDARFTGMFTGLVGLEYSRTFFKNYTVGTHFKTYLTHTGILEHPVSDGGSHLQAEAPGFRVPFSFGVYFRCSPSFVLKKFKK